MGYITRSKSLTSNDGKKVQKTKKLPSIQENKELMVDKIRQELKQKRKSKSEGELFDEIGSPINTQPHQQQLSLVEPDAHNRDEDLFNKIKDEIQAWVLPQVNYSRLTLT